MFSVNSSLDLPIEITMNQVKLLPNLLIFAEVAKYLSFTKAAQHLSLSKAAVSQSIKKLEEQINAQVLVRHTRGMMLTNTGRKLLDRTELLRHQVDLALLELEEVSQTPTGELSLTYPSIIEQSVVSPVLKQLRSEFPRICFRVESTETSLDLIEENLDVAIHIGDLKDSGYRALSLGWIKEVLCASPEYLMRQGSPNFPHDAQTGDWIQSKWQPEGLHLAKLHSPTQRDIVDFVKLNPSVQVKCSAMSSCVEMAEQGLGFVLLPELIANSCIEQGRLVRVLPDYQGRWWPVHLVHPYQKDKPKYVERFFELATHYFDKSLRGV